MANDRDKVLDEVFSRIQKEIGKDLIHRGDQTAKEASNVSWRPLSSPTLAKLMGKGLPNGRIIEMYGPEMSGKSTLSTLIAKDVMDQGGSVAYVDAENAWDYGYAKKLGLQVDSPNFLFSQPDTGEHALSIVEKLVESNAVDLIVVDSVAALVPQAEAEGEMGQSHMGLQARLLSQALRKITPKLKDGCTIIFLNQIRMKIGVMFGNPETTTGGRALRFYASIRLDVRKVEQITEGENVSGQKIRIKVVKNKVGIPFGKAEMDLIFGVGIDTYKEYLGYGVTLGIIEKAGSWYSYEGTKIGQGAANSAKYLEEHPEVFEKVKTAVDNSLFPEEIEKTEEEPPKKTSKRKKSSETPDTN